MVTSQVLLVCFGNKNFETFFVRPLAGCMVTEGHFFRFLSVGAMGTSLSISFDLLRKQKTPKLSAVGHWVVVGHFFFSVSVRAMETSHSNSKEKFELTGIRSLYVAAIAESAFKSPLTPTSKASEPKAHQLPMLPQG